MSDAQRSVTDKKFGAASRNGTTASNEAHAAEKRLTAALNKRKPVLYKRLTEIREASGLPLVYKKKANCHHPAPA